MRNALPADAPISDQTGDVVAWPRLSVGGERFEVIAQIHHGVAYRLGWHLGHLPGGVFCSDKTLGRAQQRRVIGFRRAQQARDDAECERRGDVSGKITDAVTFGDLVHRLSGPVT